MLPRADAPEALFGGFRFNSGDACGDAGVFVFTRRLGGDLYPILVGEARGYAKAIAHVRRHDAVVARDSDGLFWMARANAPERLDIVRTLLGMFDPPPNTAYRRRSAAPEIAVLVADRAFAGNDQASHLGPITVTEHELGALVRKFYEHARIDPLIGPIFAGAIRDWEGHYEVVQNFWSRTMLGTARCSGNPFGPHRDLDLRPEHFDRWIALFTAAARQVLQPTAAERAVANSGLSCPIGCESLRDGMPAA